MAASESPIFRFGRHVLDPRERRLWADGVAVNLTPKVFDTLLYLVERAGHVVSKDALMQAVWPRGYVDESNLTKHIWLIRKALGEGDEGAAFIETVPKLGYRFTAPVSVVQSGTAGPPATPAPARAAAPGSPWRRNPALRVAIGIALTLVFALAWRQGARRDAGASPTKVARVALVGMSNLSQKDGDAWLAPALVSMLGTELGSAPELQIIPSELVHDADAGLAAPAAGGYAPQVLAELRRRLHADYVVSGTYLVTPAADGANLRVDLGVQDARTGAMRAAISNQSDLDGLGALVTQTGVALRAKLGVSAPSAELAGLLENAQPPTPAVARHVGQALDDLQHHDPAQARDQLLLAIAQAPQYAPAYMYLARSWSELGYRDKALAAAEQAARQTAHLPPALRLQVIATAEEARYDWSGAADTWHSLVSAKPLSITYRLEWIHALIKQGAMPAADAALADLRRLPLAADDPRVALTAAALDAARHDPKKAAVAATQALRLAQLRESPGLIADAEYRLADENWYLSRLDQAEHGFEAAADAYHAIGNPRGEARARHGLANVLGDLQRAPEAQQAMQKSMALFQRIGDLGGVASIYQSQAEALWSAGDRDGAAVATRRALQMSRDLGDIRIQAWTLRALATIASDQAATDTTMQEYRDATALDERAGGVKAGAYGLATYADAARLRGELDEAASACREALADIAGSNDPQTVITVTYTCALVSVDRGDAAAATAALHQVRALTRADRGYDVYAANADLSLAQLDMDGARWTLACARLRRASTRFHASGIRTGEADAEALLADCAEGRGDARERDHAAARARALRSSITSEQEIFALRIALARLAHGARARAQAVAALRRLAADAERRHWLAWSLEAKLAAWRLLVGHGDHRAAAPLGADIEQTARTHHFGRVLSLLRASTPVQST